VNFSSQKANKTCKKYAKDKQDSSQEVLQINPAYLRRGINETKNVELFLTKQMAESQKLSKSNVFVLSKP